MLQSFRGILGFSLAPHSVIPDRFVVPFGIVAAVLLFIYLVNNLVKLKGQKADAAAAGCLSVVAIVTGVLLVLLAIGLMLRIRVVIIVVSVITVVPVLVLGPEIVWMVFRDWRGK